MSGPLLARLERLINGTYCESIHGSPYWAMFGREPRTRLAAMVDWSSTTFGEVALGLPSVTYNDYMEVVAQHHATLNAVQGRVMLATSVAQALTKRAWDAERTRGDYVVGEFVLVLHTAPNKMLPHFKGPFRVREVSEDGNFVMATHFQGTAVEGPYHVSRLVRFDATRVTSDELDEFLNYRVADCIGHRKLVAGQLEMHVRWEGTDITTWESHTSVRNAASVVRYAREHKLFSGPGGVSGDKVVTPAVVPVPVGSSGGKVATPSSIVSEPAVARATVRKEVSKPVTVATAAGAGKGMVQFVARADKLPAAGAGAAGESAGAVTTAAKGKIAASDKSVGAGGVRRSSRLAGGSPA